MCEDQENQEDQDFPIDDWEAGEDTNMAKWIQKAIKHPGALRKSTGTKPGKNISKAALAKASKSKNPTTRKRAALAKTLKKLHKSK